MKDFLIQYWFVLLELLIGCVSLVILIIRKNKVVLKDTAFEKLLSKLPEIMLSAEKHVVGGAEKKSFVLSVSFALLADFLGKSVDEVAIEYSDRISQAIEKILETPQKKGV